MKFLIIYSSTEGHTASIAEFLANEIRMKECQVDVSSVSFAPPVPDQYDAVVIAASIHATQYSSEVVDYVSSHARLLNQMPTAFYSVGLSILNADSKARQSLNETTTSFLRATGWAPLLTEQVAGALLYSRYGFIKKMLVRSIMKKSGGDTDTSKDYVYTNWETVRSSIDFFINHIEPVARQSC